MFHFSGTVLNNTRLEQVYYIYLTLHFISQNHNSLPHLTESPGGHPFK